MEGKGGREGRREGVGGREGRREGGGGREVLSLLTMVVVVVL